MAESIFSMWQSSGVDGCNPALFPPLFNDGVRQ
jgi:hypothetical protein